MLTLNKNIVVCGCVKNCASFLSFNLIRLLELKKIFNKVEYVFFENDSTDNTIEILKKHNVEIISYNNLNIRNKIEALSFGRNQLLEYIHKFYSDYDYILMTDLDFVLQRFKYTMLEEVFNSYPLHSWDVLTANSFEKYYDIYALRSEPNNIFPEGILFDCWQMVEKGRRSNINEMSLRKEFIGKYQKIIPNNNPLIPVLSAFGGMGIYKISVTKDCKYSTLYGCEHVAFNKEIRDKHNARIFICPKLQVCGESLHIV